MAALVGIRKMFDFGVFTQQDLMWLDDIMPESAKKKRDDARKKKEEEAKMAAEVFTCYLFLKTRDDKELE